jgi:hypothetical protein
LNFTNWAFLYNFPQLDITCWKSHHYNYLKTKNANTTLTLKTEMILQWTGRKTIFSIFIANYCYVHNVSVITSVEITILELLSVHLRKLWNITINTQAILQR